jgi:hypothetical protein
MFKWLRSKLNDKCIRKTIYYRILAVGTQLPIVFLVEIYLYKEPIYNALGGAAIVSLLTEVILHSLIYYLIEKRDEELHKRKCIICESGKNTK